ncbi:hypothetical protein ES703_82072 [subsurface metagenome]
MNQNNVYNYVESKRELWICIRKKFYEQYRDENRTIIKNHEGSTVELLLDLFDHFFKFAEEDYGAFAMMHIIPSPPQIRKDLLRSNINHFTSLMEQLELFKKP